MFYIIDSNKTETSLYIYKTSRTARGAKIALASLKKKNPDANLVVVDEFTYSELDTEVEVRNLMSGTLVKIRKSDRGTCCDPSMERYWTM